MRGKKGRYLAYGRNSGGRFLLVVWAFKNRKTKIITDRDMTKKEKQFFMRRRK
ncbi:MAG: BrnT family toxin [Deltaproteobacteria bacterium]|nr:BrnT family toxin [Deltaproteobacteria bacterium]